MNSIVLHIVPPISDPSSSIESSTVAAAADDDDTPIMLSEPKDTYASKSTPAKLSCRVAHALSVHYDCNGEILRATKEQNIVEPESGVRYVESELVVSRDKMEEFLSDYHCACVAIGKGEKATKSRMAMVSFACKYTTIRTINSGCV